VELVDPIAGILLPVGVGVVALLLGWRPWDRTASRGRFSALASALALVGAYLLAHVAYFDLPPLPPVEAWHQLGLLVLVSLVLVPLEGIGGGVRTARWTLKSVVVAAFLWIGLSPKREHRWEGFEEVLWLGGTFLVWMLALGALSDLARRRARGLSLPLSLLLTFSAAAAALGFSGSLVFARLAGALAAVLGVFCAVALWRPDLPLLERAHVPAGIALVGLATCGAFFSQTPAAVAALLAFLPQAARFPGGDGLRPAFLRGTLVTLCGGVLVWLARGEPDPSSQYY